MKYLKVFFLFAICLALFSCTHNNQSEEMDYETLSEMECDEEGCSFCPEAGALIPDPQEIALDFDSTQW